MAALTFTANPSFQEVGPDRGNVLTNGARGNGQAMRLDGTVVQNSQSHPVQVEVRSDDGLIPFQFDQQKQYTVTIAEVV